MSLRTRRQLRGLIVTLIALATPMLAVRAQGALDAKSAAHLRDQYIGDLDTVHVKALTGRYTPWDVTFDQPVFGMSGDLQEHLGQLISYARSVGVKLPWSK